MYKQKHSTSSRHTNFCEGQVPKHDQRRRVEPNPTKRLKINIQNSATQHKLLRDQSKGQPHSSSFLNSPDELSPLMLPKSTYRDKNQDRLLDSEGRAASKDKSFKKYFSYRKPTSGTDLMDNIAQNKEKQILKLTLDCFSQGRKELKAQQYATNKASLTDRLPNKIPYETSRPTSNISLFISKPHLSYEQQQFIKAEVEPLSSDKQQYSTGISRNLKQTASTLSTMHHLNLTLQTQHYRPGRCQKKQRKFSPDDFVFLKPLGFGKFSKVFSIAHRESGFICSLKCIKKAQIIEEKLMCQLIRQIKISSFVQHPNIISLYSFFEDSKNFYLLSELATDGQLYEKLKRVGKFSEEATAFIIRQILLAVSYLHSHKIYHRDIKPENIVVCHGIVKLCDLGWSVHVPHNQLRTTLCGTPLYASPEILQGQHYDQKIDLWAIGMLGYELYFGSIPFDIKRQQDLVRIITDDVQFPENCQTSQQFKDFIESILQKNPMKRLNCKQLLRHPFILKYQAFQTNQEVCLA